MLFNICIHWIRETHSRSLPFALILSCCMTNTMPALCHMGSRQLISVEVVKSGCTFSCRRRQLMKAATWRGGKPGDSRPWYVATRSIFVRNHSSQKHSLNLRRHMRYYVFACVSPTVMVNSCRVNTQTKVEMFAAKFRGSSGPADR